MVTTAAERAPRIGCIRTEARKVSRAVYGCGGACAGCHVTIKLGDGGFERRVNRLWGRDGAVRRHRRGLRACSG
jgi:hypothetical protein